MPKLTLTFDTSDPDDKKEAELAVHGTDLYLALWDIEQYLRKVHKYEDLPEIVDDKVTEIRDMFYQILDAHGLTKIME